MTRVLIIDNYDSFTYNLVQGLGALGATVEVVRHDQATVDALLDTAPDRVVISPGPCTPDDSGISLEAARRFPAAGIPLLGVCLGHQALGQAFGGTVIRHEPVHGKPCAITHDGQSIYRGLENPLEVGRYHSLVLSEADLPACFTITARGGGADGNDVIQGIRHRELPAEGVQFHPESVLTPHGIEILRRFLDHGVQTSSEPERSDRLR